ncbi:hypothetical protein MKY27_14030 [Solibacillus sp. FSL R5-0449]|uniref:hypothetical protein n=1 Tax=Solibacillus sp. FSL R5-0449 TaxID=2921639 RepID=UPI0030D14D11
MKVKHICFFILILASFFSTGCTNNELEENEIDTKVRNAVLDYIEQESWNTEFYKINEWRNASVEKIKTDDSYKNIDNSYIGKEIFVVTIVDALSAPLIFVDPETLNVIGIMPGE